MIRSGSFQFIPKVLDRVEVRALCRPVKFFQSKLGKLFLYGDGFVYRGHVKTGEDISQCVATVDKHILLSTLTINCKITLYDGPIRFLLIGAQTMKK